MDQYEKFENQLLNSYEKVLVEESRNICKKLELLFLDDDEFNNIKTKIYSENIFIVGKDIFNIMKANSYIPYCLKKDSINKYFLNKCIQLNYDINNFISIKKDLNRISETRKSQKISL